MGLFDKKTCDICGKDIGLLGNRKLKDGNCCKDCVSKLSPFFSDRKASTVNEIKQQLAYREANAAKIPSFSPSQVIGTGFKVYIDGAQKKFIATRSTNWKASNPDIVNISDVTSVKTTVTENKSEVYDTDASGKRVSYNPKMYEFEYRFNTQIYVRNPYFDDMTFELTVSRPTEPFGPEYEAYAQMADDIQMALTGTHWVDNSVKTWRADLVLDAPEVEQPEVVVIVEEEHVVVEPEVHHGYVNQTPVVETTTTTGPKLGGIRKELAAGMKEGEWLCNCGRVNSGNFCANCGSPRPAEAKKYCPNCGGKLEGFVKFCPQCGKQIQ